MTDRPILFSAPMVRAVMAGNKTQTRRIVKLPHNNPLGKWEPTTFGGPDGGRTRKGETIPLQTAIWHTRTGDSIGARWVVGDRLWLRETYRFLSVHDHVPPRELSSGPVWYEAQDMVPFHPSEFGKLRPSMFMPRWASRITLEVTGVRVERLQEISEADAKAEGAPPREVRQMWLYGANESKRVAIYREAAVDPYRDLWKQINGPSSWDLNPWVWVVEFSRIKP